MTIILFKKRQIYKCLCVGQSWEHHFIVGEKGVFAFFDEEGGVFFLQQHAVEGSCVGWGEAERNFVDGRCCHCVDDGIERDFFWAADFVNVQSIAVVIGEHYGIKFIDIVDALLHDVGGEEQNQEIAVLHCNL